MLYDIAITDDDCTFMRCLEGVKKSLYDERDYNTESKINKLPDWTFGTLPDEEIQLKEINRRLSLLITDVCRECGGKYLLHGNEKTRMEFPFIEKYHSFFLKRKWNKPIRDPRREQYVTELLRLHKPAGGAREFQNYSRNSSDYNHFLNVVASTARFIKHFERPENILGFICPSGADQNKWEKYAGIVAFSPKKHGLRIFTLMLSAFFHDIGKTVVYHRHGMEGSIIFSENTSQAWYQLNRIANRYEFGDDFDRNDLLLISDMLKFHDKFGTLATGEAGYMQLIEIIDSIKHYSLKYDSKEQQREWCTKSLFDLWLLNVADIMVSMEHKGEWQPEWETIEGSIEKIKSFTQRKNKINLLVHDLDIANNLMTIANRHRHTDVYSELEVQAQKYSDRHVVERIRRMVYACVELSAARGYDHLDNIKEIIDYFLHGYSLSEVELTSSIVNSINSTRDFRDFCNRFSWIGQMDYALGFFESITSRALKRINDELKNLPEPTSNSPMSDKVDYCFRTKWIRDKFSGNLGNDEDASKHLGL